MRKIFAELQGNYGSRFLDMWRSGQTLDDGRDAGIENAKGQWADKLAGFATCPERIGKALKNLPQHPPTLPEFVALCRQQYGEQHKALPAPMMSDEQYHDRMAELERAARRIAEPHQDMLGWARTPPVIGSGDSWERLIVDLVIAGDGRFRPILAEHMQAGVIKSERARGAMGMYDNADAA